MQLLSWALLGPLFERCRRGEGVLLAVSLSWLWWHSPSRAWIGAAIALLAAACVYALNDVLDAKADLDNPRKNHTLARLLVVARTQVLFAIAALIVLQVVVAFLCLESRAAASLAALHLVNAAYCQRLKRVPVLDVIAVGVGGAAFLAVVCPSALVCAWIGLVTASCHLFQMMGDADADARARIRTTYVHSPVLGWALLLALSGASAFVLTARWGILIGTSALLPPVLGVLYVPMRAWLLAKAYFGVIWLALLFGR